MDFSKELDAHIKNMVSESNFSGVVLIKKGNEELFSGCYGYANRSFKVKNTIDTRFRIASVSKMFTATAILQLVDNGLISLDTSAYKYLELKYTKIPNDVTIHHLLTHTSGIADYYNEADGDEAWEKLWKDKPIYNMRETKDYFDMFAYDEPVFKAGERFLYNGAEYILLGLIIEKASGMAYFDYVKKNIFDKIGMQDSGFFALDDVADKVAEGYEPVCDSQKKIIAWKKNIYTATAGAASDGGATSTANDLVNFIQALKSGRLLSKDMTEKILTPMVLDQDSNGARGYTWKYGYANWFILDDKDNIVRGGHTGEEYGVSARLYYYPQKSIDIAILANQGFCAGSLGWKINELIMN